MSQRPAKTTITSVETLCAHWTRLLAAADQRGRSLWLMFHDGDGVLDDLAIAVDDLPLRPERQDGESVAAMVRMSTAAGPRFEHCIALLSRPGTARSSPYELEWNRTLAVVSEFMIWPVCCGTPHGVVPLNNP